MFDLKSIVPPLVTPFDESGAVVYADFEGNFEKYLSAGIEGYLVLGSNGEAVYLERDEKLKLIQIARKKVPESMMLLAGTGVESTQATIRLTREAADLGVDGVLIKNPFYFKSLMTSDVYRAHYAAVADASPVPVVLYNVPMFTGISMAGALMTELARHPNIRGVKESAGNVQLISEMAWATADNDFSIVAGSAPTLFPNMMAGARGGIVALACAAPAAMLRVYEAFKTGDYAAAASAQEIIAPAAVAVTARFGVPGLKAAMALEGFRSGVPRRPLLALGAAEQAELKTVFDTMNSRLEGVGVGSHA
jgi:4-hydroxy-2-oxoglutarate aldolase